jgi:hypothetical protein
VLQEIIAPQLKHLIPRLRRFTGQQIWVYPGTDVDARHIGMDGVELRPLGVDDALPLWRYQRSRLHDAELHIQGCGGARLIQKVFQQEGP